MKQIFAVVLIVVAITSLITISFTFNQVNREGERLENDIRYRSSLLADGLKDSVEPNFTKRSDQSFQSLVKKYNG